MSDRSEHGLCVAAHRVDPDRPRPVGRGYLCHGCDKHLEKTVAEIPALVDELNQTLARIATAGPRTSGNPEHPLPYAPLAADALRHLHLMVGTWAMHVADTRGVTMPRRPTTQALATFLVTHHEWLVHQPEVDDYKQGILDAYHQARRAVAPSITRKIDLGLCGDIVTCDVQTRSEEPCGGILRAVVADDGAVPDVVCTSCETVHTPTHFRALARRLRKDQEAWLTTAQASSLLQVPSGTVRRWAVEDEWRRLERTETKLTRWHADDVQATFDARRTAPSREDVRETRRHPA